MLRLTSNFLLEKKISISNENINLIVNKSNGDRDNLKNELIKIETFCFNKKKISTEEITKLINLTENHSISELIDNCLAKNSNKTVRILNENNFNKDDSIVIIRTFLNKSKKILNLSNQFKKNNSAKPPIFWKDKEITKKQILEWSPKNIKKLINDINEMELQVKKNIDISLSLITDFILHQSSSRTNN